MIESLYDSAQKSEVNAIVLSYFQDSHNVVTDSQCTKSFVLHKKTAKLIQDDSKLVSLFIQL